MKKIFAIIILSALFFSFLAFLPKNVLAETEKECVTKCNDTWVADNIKCQKIVTVGDVEIKACEKKADDDNSKCQADCETKSSAGTTGGSGAIRLPTDKPSNLPTDIKINNVIQTVFNVIVSVGEVAFIIMLLVGGVMYITSGGDEAGAGKAKKMITSAIIGIVILLSAWAIATWVVDILKGIS